MEGIEKQTQAKGVSVHPLSASVCVCSLAVRRVFSVICFSSLSSRCPGDCVPLQMKSFFLAGHCLRFVSSLILWWDCDRSCRADVR